MKEKIKKALLTISIFYSVGIIILIIITNNNLVTTVELHDSNENKNKLQSYKEDLSKLEQNSCAYIINKIIKHYEETSYDGTISLKEMYENDLDNSLLSYYTKAKDSCNLSKENEEKYNLPQKFITASIQRDEMYQKYYFQYELQFKDSTNRLIIEPYITGIEYEINRKTELEIISSLIELLSEESAINE